MADDAPPMLMRIASFIPQGSDKERGLKKDEAVKAAKKVVRPKQEEEEDAPSIDLEQPEGWNSTAMKIAMPAASSDPALLVSPR